MNETYVFIGRDKEGKLRITISGDPECRNSPAKPLTGTEARDLIVRQMSKFYNPVPVPYSNELALRYKEACALLDLLEKSRITYGEYIFLKDKFRFIV